MITKLGRYATIVLLNQDEWHYSKITVLWVIDKSITFNAVSRLWSVW
jgi:hypothetical protein